MVTYETKLKDVYRTPIGKDMIDKLFQQIDKNPAILNHVMIRNLKMKTLAKITRKKIDKNFYDAFLKLINLETSKYETKTEYREERIWWKEAVFYQIYPRSFKDSNGDGVGDIGGIIEKLDYLKNLGVTCLWLSPIYDSPNDDNGYDIRDYKKIMKEFGTMDDFDRLLSNLHRRGMRLIMDLVVNHTSDEHEWFQKALQDKQNEEHDYYIFKEGTETIPPNNWTSFFEGPAWNYYRELGEWGLHLFSKKQMDLNWDNPQLREKVYEIITWWLNKGVDGFRMDVGNLISKPEELPDGNPMIGELIGICGIENYIYGPNLNAYLKELRGKGFQGKDKFLVGETPGIGLELAKFLTSKDQKEMDMIFNFDHLETPGHVRFEEYTYDLNYYKTYMIHWMKYYGKDNRMSLFYDNHDNPRMLSKINPEPKYRMIAAKLLATMQMTLRGTPFIFQGEEIGMQNAKFRSMDEIKDVESQNRYQELLHKMSPEEAFKNVLSGTRDHARVPMQWTKEKYAGFSEYQPWMEGDKDYLTTSVEEQIFDQNSTVHFYKKLIALRNDSLVLKYGDIQFVGEKRKDFFGYFRTPALDDESCKNKKIYFIECNLSNHRIKRQAKKGKYKRILSNYERQQKKIMQPYEANIYEVY